MTSHWFNKPAYSQESFCPQSLPYGELTKLSQSTNMCKRGFAISYANEAKIPFWVSYVLDHEKALGCEPRRQFHDDTTLDYRFQSHQRNYKGSGFDIGHNVNAADMAYSKESSYDSFLMSNMSPQLPGFNRGIWKKLEMQVREWALEDELTIYTGNIFNKKSDKLPGNITIPVSMFKVIIDNKTKEYLAFVFPHIEKEKNLEEYIVSLDDLQKQTGITFALPEGAKERIILWPKIEGYETLKQLKCKGE